MVRMAWQKLSLSAIWDLVAVSELNKQEVVLRTWTTGLGDAG